MRYGTKIQRRRKSWNSISRRSPARCRRASRSTRPEARPYFTASTRSRSACSPTASDFWALNPLGMVPVLRTEEGDLLKENPAVLQYVADHFPAAGLAPSGGPGALQAAAMAELHRHGAAQGNLHSAARREGTCRREGLRAREGGAPPWLSRSASRRRANSCSTGSASPTPIS